MLRKSWKSRFRAILSIFIGLDVKLDSYNPRNITLGYKPKQPKLR